MNFFIHELKLGFFSITFFPTVIFFIEIFKRYFFFLKKKRKTRQNAFNIYMRNKKMLHFDVSPEKKSYFQTYCSVVTLSLSQDFVFVKDFFCSISR